MSSITQTPLQGKAAIAKLETIEHVNEDHRYEMMLVVKAFTQLGEVVDAELQDVFEEGVTMNAFPTEHAEPIPVFVPFTVEGETHVKVRTLAGDAMNKLQIRSDRNRQRYFEVINIRHHTANMLRLTLRCEDQLPAPQGGYVCSFLLSHFDSLADAQQAFPRGLTDDAVSRAYTYRRINTQDNTIDVDIFMHGEEGESPANTWAKSLKPGHFVRTIGERPERFEHVHAGKALICADETSLPAIAGLLGFWGNPEPPIVVVEVGHQAEFAYLDDCEKPTGTEVIFRVRNHTAEVTQGEAINAYLEQYKPPVEVAWGALGSKGARHVRNFIREQYQLTSKQVRVSAYWKQT